MSSSANRCVLLAPMRHRHRSSWTRFYVALAAAVILSGCGERETRPSDDASTQPRSAPNADQGRPLTLYTHCGVWSTEVDGRLWLADPPLHDGSHNPLPGWDVNDTQGIWRELGGGEAEFRADSGEIARFVLAPAPAGFPYPDAGVR